MDQTSDHSSFHNESVYLNATLEWKKPIRYVHPFSDSVSRGLIIFAYSLVFLACFIGNALVLFVIIRNQRMRTRTNIFLANLAVADLCVSLICIFPNMHTYLFLQWYLGKVMCKLYKFVESINLTASMLLMEVIAVERYIAINHPLKTRWLFTIRKMRFAQLTVWLVASLYNVPIFFMYNLYEVTEPWTNNTSYFCHSSEQMNLEYNPMSLYDSVTFALWYMFPLLAMTVMYASMAKTLWKTTLPKQTSFNTRHTEEHSPLPPLHLKPCNTNKKLEKRSTPHKNEKRKLLASTSSSASDTSIQGKRQQYTGNELGVPTGQESYQCYNKNSSSKGNASCTDDSYDWIMPKPQSVDEEPITPFLSSNSTSFENIHFSTSQEIPSKSCIKGKHPSQLISIKLLDNSFNESNSPKIKLCRPPRSKSCRFRLTSHRASRRRVVRLLVIVLCSFAILVLPHHVRLLLTRFHKSLRMGPFTSLACHLLMFLNSAVNPVLYGLLSQSFRRNLKYTFNCSKSARKKDQNPLAWL